MAQKQFVLQAADKTGVMPNQFASVVVAFHARDVWPEEELPGGCMQSNPLPPYSRGTKRSRH